MSKETKRTALFAAILIAIGVITRLVPHPANFAAIGALALFGGAHLPKWASLGVPITAMLIADLFIGFDSPGMRLIVYGSFALSATLGWLIKKDLSVFSVGGASLAGSLLFFFATNTGTWALTAMYPSTLSGLILAYIMGLPFLSYTVLGDLMWAGAFFGSYALFKRIARARSSVTSLPNTTSDQQVPARAY